MYAICIFGIGDVSPEQEEAKVIVSKDNLNKEKK
jgi:hypothetical protein